MAEQIIGQHDCHQQQLPVVRAPGVSRRSGAKWALCEACLWTLGFLFAQGLVLAVLLTVMVTASFGMQLPSQEQLIVWMLESDLDRSFLLVGVPVLGALFLILPVIRWREGQNFRQKIGWRLPSSDETVYALATVVPVALIGNQVYEVMNAWWCGERLVWPFAVALRETSLDHLYRSFQGVPYPVLVVALALAPAVIEELVFRGILGRRLVSQFGVVPGVCLASMLFAAVHGSPPHAIATLPIAVLLHALYLQTGTIWVPILIHFCNNLLAISMVQFKLSSENPVSALFLFAICLYLGVILLLLRSRLSGPAPFAVDRVYH